MKKLLLILVLCTAPALAYFEPEWSEFCPYGYRNISTSKDYKIPIKKYWQQRRINFEKNKSYCKTVSDVDACYAELRRIENEKTQIIQRQQINGAMYVIK